MDGRDRGREVEGEMRGWAKPRNKSRVFSDPPKKVKNQDPRTRLGGGVGVFAYVYNYFKS